MSVDDIFRLALVLLAAVFMPIGLYHRLQAHTGEKIDRWQEGVVILFGLRLAALMVFVAVIAWLVKPSSMAWSRLPLPPWLRWTGLAVAVCGGILWVYTVQHLGRNLTDTVVTRRQHVLVTTGPYRWVRHPFYIACLLMLLGVSLTMANWFILLASSILWFAFLFPRTRIEEQNLLDRFGDDYRNYAQRVGRFVPRLPL
jgi:protein-S-isoprenylcysteine O-methyltransferase Ste14